MLFVVAKVQTRANRAIRRYYTRETRYMAEGLWRNPATSAIVSAEENNNFSRSKTAVSTPTNTCTHLTISLFYQRRFHPSFLFFRHENSITTIKDNAYPQTH